MKRRVILGLAIFILFSMMSWGAATISLIATPSVVASGGKTVISWTTTGASKVYFNGVGYVSLNGSRNYYPTKTTTYTVQAYGSTGWVSKSVTVTVSSGNVPTVSFSATPTVITLGGSATLQWNVQNASSISINQGIGSVAASGSTAVTPTATTTYTLTATNSYGTKTASVSVAVQAPLPTITTTVTPDPIQLGQPVVISWTTQYANQVTIDQGIGAVALNGSITVALTKTITYTFTASGPGGTATRQLTFTLPELPIVTLTAQPAEVNAGDAATLVWTSENATELTLEPGIGAVAASGSMIVYPQATTTYKLVAVGGAGQAQATATVTVLSGRKIRAFAVHGSERVISVINLETQGVIRDIPLAFEPAGLALTRDGMWLYIADPANNQVQRMSTQDYALTKVYVVPGVPSELAMSEDGDYLFVAGKAGGCDGSGSYCFHTIDLKSGQIVRGLSFANELSSLCLDSSRHLLYALSRENKTVWALDAAALIAGQSAQEVIRSQLELDKTVNALTLAGDNSTLYAATDENISYIELNNFYVNYWLAIKDQDGTVLPIQYVVGMPDGSKLLVLLKRDAYKLIVFNQQTNALSMIPFAAAGSSFARLHPDGLRMVIATSGSPLLTIGDMQSEALSGEINTGAPVAESGLVVGEILNAVSGRVLAGGAALAGVQVNFQLGLASRVATTDGEGKYLLGLEAGTYTARAEKFGYAFQPETVNVEVQGGITVPDIVGTLLAPTIELSASPLEVKGGEASTLTWSSQYADAVVLGPMNESVAASGSRQVSPAATTLYAATASGPGGSTSAEITVTVLPPPQVTFFRSVPETVAPGGTATLQWETQNGESAEIAPGVGAVAPSGQVTVTPAQSTAYTLTVTGRGGSTQATVTVGVYEKPVASLTATPTEIKLGESATLAWSTQNADTASIAGIGIVALNGSIQVQPEADTVYILSAQGPGGSAQAQIQVNVHPKPTIEFSVSPGVFTPGTKVVLAWSVQNATSISIDQGIGAVAESGTLEVAPVQTTTYTLTAQGLGGMATASVTVLSLESHIQIKWGEMRQALLSGDIEGALAYFDDQFKEAYRKRFLAFQEELSTFASEIGTIVTAEVFQEDARFVILRKEMEDGQELLFGYDLIFVKNKNDDWKILHF